MITRSLFTWCKAACWDIFFDFLVSGAWRAGDLPNLVVEHLPGMHEALSSIANTTLWEWGDSQSLFPMQASVMGSCNRHRSCSRASECCMHATPFALTSQGHFQADPLWPVDHTVEIKCSFLFHKVECLPWTSPKHFLCSFPSPV